MKAGTKVRLTAAAISKLGESRKRDPGVVGIVQDEVTIQQPHGRKETGIRSLVKWPGVGMLEPVPDTYLEVVT